VTETDVDDDAAPDDNDGGVTAPDGAEETSEVVLAWWQHPVNIITLLIATALVAGMIGWLVHDAVAGDDAGEVDIGFLHDMRWHHEQAVAMSFIYLDAADTDPSLRTVARTIAAGQSLEIGRMVQLLRDFDAPEAGNRDEPAMTWMGMETTVETMPGMATEAELDALRDAEGRAADELFVQLMSDHHLGGVHMAEFAAENAESGEVRAAAQSMVQSQRSDIAEMEGVLGA
jgi:uncharacterized protein (DUF305 family)